MAIIVWLMRALVPVIVILCEVVGSVVSVVWLASLGEWAAIGYWFAAAFGAHILVHFVMAPSVLLALPIRYFERRNISIGVHFMGFLSTVYLIGIMAIWCVVVFVLFAIKADSLPIIPVLVLSFGVATGPWALTVIKAGGEAGDDVYQAAAAVFITQVGYLVMLAMVLLFQKTYLEAFVTFGIIMLLNLFFQLAVARCIAQLARR